MYRVNQPASSGCAVIARAAASVAVSVTRTSAAVKSVAVAVSVAITAAQALVWREKGEKITAGEALEAKTAEADWSAGDQRARDAIHKLLLHADITRLFQLLQM